MSRLDTPDSDWNHLYPPFRGLLRVVFTEVARVTGCPWRLAEGYRSPERQLHLWAKGRTEPGPKVTWMRFPKWHGSGLAADCYPTNGALLNDRAAYEAFRRLYQQHGLGNPAWVKGDLGHVQLSDEQLRVTATGWCERGFPALSAPGAPPAAPAAPPTPAPTAPPGPAVLVNDIAYPSIPAFLDDGAAWVALRPLCDVLALAIVRLDLTGGPAGGTAWLEADPPGAGSLAPEALPESAGSLRVPVRLRGGTGYVRAVALDPICRLVWDGPQKRLKFYVRPDPGENS